MQIIINTIALSLAIIGVTLHEDGKHAAAKIFQIIGTIITILLLLFTIMVLYDDIQHPDGPPPSINFRIGEAISQFFIVVVPCFVAIAGLVYSKKEKYFVAKLILFGGLLAMVITGLVFLGIMHFTFN